ncbi:MAG: CoA-binding protein, partial [Gemmatimonadetes bacterium]
MPIVDEDRVRGVVQQARTVAVLGAHPQAWRPAHY